MSNLVDFAKREFEELGWLNGDDEMQRMACNNVIELLQTLSDQDHSGFSVSYVLSVFDSLARYKPITEIKDDYDFWVECGNDVMQHKKMSTIFKDGGKVHWLDGVIFEMESGTRYSSSDSKVIIKLPLRASDLKTEIILVDEDGACINKEEFNKYVGLSEKIRYPNIEGRKPKE